MEKRLITSRKVDKLGRAVLGCKPGTIVDFFTNGDEFILKTREMSCAICDTTDGEFKKCHNKSVCLNCASILGNMGIKKNKSFPNGQKIEQSETDSR